MKYDARALIERLLHMATVLDDADAKQNEGPRFSPAVARRRQVNRRRNKAARIARRHNRR